MRITFAIGTGRGKPSPTTVRHLMQAQQRAIERAPQEEQQTLDTIKSMLRKVQRTLIRHQIDPIPDRVEEEFIDLLPYQDSVAEAHADIAGMALSEDPPGMLMGVGYHDRRDAQHIGNHIADQLMCDVRGITAY